MTNIEIIKMLVNAIDTNGEQDEALKQAAVALLDNLKVAPKTDPAKIADELGTTSVTVRNHLKREETA